MGRKRKDGEEGERARKGSVGKRCFRYGVTYDDGTKITEIGRWLKYLHESVHNGTNDQTGNDGTEESKGHDGTEVPEKVAAFHGKAGVENDRWQHDVEKEFWVERGLLLIFAKLGVRHAFVESVCKKGSLN